MIVIVGGGIVGSNLSKELSEKGLHDIHVIEEHDHTRKTCSALITGTIPKHVLPSKFITNKIYDAVIHAPNGKILQVHFKEPDITFAREQFIDHLQSSAEKKGVEFHRRTKLRSILMKPPLKVNAEQLSDNDLMSFSPNTLIGADGALSFIGRSSGLVPERIPHFVAIKAKAKLRNSNEINFYPYIKDFAWAIPLDDRTVEIGVAARSNSSASFDALCKKLDVTPFDKEAAILPIYNPHQRIFKKAGDASIALVGDAAGQVKATTGGGIVFGLQASQILADCISRNRVSSYPVYIKSSIGKELWLHSFLRKYLDRMRDEDWNSLIEKCSDTRITQKLGNISRDELSKLIVTGVLHKPSLLKFGKMVFRR